MCRRTELQFGPPPGSSGGRLLVLALPGPADLSADLADLSADLDCLYAPLLPVVMSRKQAEAFAYNTRVVSIDQDDSKLPALH